MVGAIDINPVSDSNPLYYIFNYQAAKIIKASSNDNIEPLLMHLRSYLKEP